MGGAVILVRNSMQFPHSHPQGSATRTIVSSFLPPGGGDSVVRLIFAIPEAKSLKIFFYKKNGVPLVVDFCCCSCVGKDPLVGDFVPSNSWGMAYNAIRCLVMLSIFGLGTLDAWRWTPLVGHCSGEECNSISFWF